MGVPQMERYAVKFPDKNALVKWLADAKEKYTPDELPRFLAENKERFEEYIAFIDGNKVRNAKFLKVELNGQILHEDLEMPGPTPGGVTGKESSTGPLMFQGNHGPVAYRNIVVKPLLK